MHRIALDRSAFDLAPGASLPLTLPRLGRRAVTLDRIIRHDSGSLTWVGHLTHAGRDFRVMLTLGAEGGLFGRILAPEAEFAIESRDGAHWLVDLHEAGRRHLVPPIDDTIATPPADDGAAQGAAPSIGLAAALPAKPTTVDLMILYTSGMVSRYGSGLTALIDSLVALANQAYLDSQVNMRLRVVRLAQVGYSDANANSVALTEMREGQIAAFADVEAQRAMWGADLVTLLRPLSYATHGNCGVGYRPLSTNPVSFNARYAYSIVSVGTDVGGSGFHCVDYGLAHETGHNLGSNHDRAHHSGGDVWFPYSFGYGQDGSFGTIMTYIFPIVGRFSNPNILCLGATACGVASTEDNARSLNELAPMVADYKPATVPMPGVRGDFEDDGRADVLWRHAPSGQNSVWLMSGTASRASAALAKVTDPLWKVAAVADLNGDGKSDIIWRHAASGENVLWLMNGAARSSSAFLPRVADGAWRIAGAGDFDGDGRADLLWRHAVTGQNVVWLMNGATRAGWSYAPTVPDSGWTVTGVGDLNGDGKADVLWRHATSGQNVAWLMNGTGVASTAFLSTVADAGWTVQGVGDFNGDGRADLLWRHSVSGQNVVWLMNGASIASRGNAPTVANAAWNVAAVGDYDGNGTADLFWRNEATGENVVWLMSGATRTSWSYVPGMADPDWKIVGGK